MTRLIEEAITGWYGRRCAEAEPGCPICDAWAEFDALTTRPEPEQGTTDTKALRYADLHGMGETKKAQIAGEYPPPETKV